MKVVFAGGGTGGHFYPLIAVAEAIHEAAAEKRLVASQLYYLAPEPFDEDSLFQNSIVFMKVPAGKVRRYFSIQNFTGIFATLSGIIAALSILLKIYPDVVFSKGGYTSVPVVIAARMLGIPIVIHESDAKPGRANLMAAPMAYRIAVAFGSAIQYFPPKTQSKIARIGIPVRREVAHIEREGADQLMGLEQGLPTILIVGGSLGSKRINDTVMEALPELVSFANVIHQTGKAHLEEVTKTASVVLGANPTKGRYHPFSYLNSESMRRAAGAANLVIARAGATTITEISLWGVPSILIPIPESVSHDQRTNAYAYAETGAAAVMEESNLSPHLLASEAKRITSDAAVSKQMSTAAGTFATGDAARIIADELITISLSHEAEAGK